LSFIWAEPSRQVLVSSTDNENQVSDSGVNRELEERHSVNNLVRVPPALDTSAGSEWATLVEIEPESNYPAIIALLGYGGVVPAPRAPWWLYLAAASFLGYFTLQIYNYVWGPWWVEFDSDDSAGSMIVSKVSPEGAAERAGLRTGDRIVAVDGIPIRGGKRNFDFYRATANFEAGRPMPIEVERQGKPIELTLRLRRKSLTDLGWLDWERIGAAVFTLILALAIGARRPGKNLVPGTIVILHDGISDPSRSIEALPHILTAGHKKGLRFTSIGALVREAARPAETS
jgi:membrane-associated protease RseP (regulator of RpoE activity)